MLKNGVYSDVYFEKKKQLACINLPLTYVVDHQESIWLYYVDKTTGIY